MIIESFGTLLHTLLHGRRVGADEFGNRYYVGKGDHREGGRQRRWVLYKGAAEASKVPPDWHAWLHHTIATPPSEQPLPAKPWEKEHEANRTGTAAAYVPQGSVLAGGERPRATGDYQAWRPN